MRPLSSRRTITLKKLLQIIREEIQAQQAGLVLKGKEPEICFCDPRELFPSEVISFIKRAVTLLGNSQQPQIMRSEFNHSGAALKKNPIQLLLVPVPGFFQKQRIVFTWRYGLIFTSYEIEFLAKFSSLLSWVMGEEALTAEASTTIKDFYGLVGQSHQFQKLVENIKRISHSDAPVMIMGESGTGKELIARAIHLDSCRAEKEFIPLNCAALPELLLESELFGFTRGAFTGATQSKPGLIELADEGTFFLDEIADLSPVLQAKILRLIQEGELRRLGETKVRKINTRFISATNRDIEVEVNRGNFRRDLFYRLRVIAIKVPPLRERREDIPLLLTHFLRKYRVAGSQKSVAFSPRAVEILVGYDWPGNIRELENEVRRCLALFPERELLTEECLSPCFFPDRKVVSQAGAPFDYFQAKAEFERRFLHQALTRFNFNKSKTAAEIGLSRQGLFKLLKKHKIALPQGVQNLEEN